MTPLESLLNPDQLSRLINYLDARIQSVDASLIGFRDKRKRFEKQMDDNFEWRRGGGRDRGNYAESGLDNFANDIFDLQNDSVNIVGGFAAFMTARTVDDIFGTDPYFALNPEGLMDDSLSQTMQKHSEWKLRSAKEGNWREAGIDAIDYAVGIGEGVMKSYYCKEVDVFETRQVVLVDLDGKPILTVDGAYIFQEDVAPSQAVDATGAAVPVLTVTKDPTLALDVRTLAWKEMDIEQTNVSFDNVKTNLMHFGDILVPENAPSFEESDFVGHQFQKRLSWIRSKYQIPPDVLSSLQTDNTDAKTEESKPIEHLGETGEHQPQSDNPDPMIKLVESWVKYDPVGDGRIRRMYILYAPGPHRCIITMDYIANMTPEGALPFRVIRAFKVKNRWYGRGYFEIYEKAQEFIDRHLCYVAYRNRFHSNPAKFFDPSLLLEDEDTEDDIMITPGSTMRKKPGVKSEDVLSFVEFPDLDERTWQLMQMMIQVIQVRSGVTSAAQGEVSSLPSTATATGIESILASASTLARLPMGNIKHGLESSLLYTIKLIYANANRDEIFTYFEGDTQKVGTLEAARVKDLDMNVRLLLTRFKQREQVETAEKAITLITGQYLPLPEPEKSAVRPLFIQVVKGLGFDQADTIVRAPIQMIDPLTGQPIGPAPVMPEGAAPPPGGEAPPPQQPQVVAAPPPPADL